MKFSIKDFFSKYEHIRGMLQEILNGKLYLSYNEYRGATPTQRF